MTGGWVCGLRIPALVLALAVAAGIAAPASGQVAVPYYGPEAFVAALQARFQAPHAQQFDVAAGALVEAIEALCAAPKVSSREAAKAAKAAAHAATDSASGEAEDPDEQPGSPRLQAREAWLAAADAWERLQALSVGATIERRSARSIDFRPARPPLIKRAVATHGRGKEPPDAKALERVGTPAKGLPAIEWLLWDSAAPRTSTACRYATGLAQEVRREASALAQAHAADAGRDWREEGEAAAERAAEAVNQWLAGLEALRWRQLGKPLAVLASKSSAPGAANPTMPGIAAPPAASPLAAPSPSSSPAAAAPDPHDDMWPRPPSASHRDAWQARWDSLRTIAIGPAPTDGFGPQPAVPPSVVSLEAMLRGRGRNNDADAWAQAVMAADQAMQALTEAGAAPATTGQELAALPPIATQLPPAADMQRAVVALDAVKRLMRETVAPSLQVTLGFSDADGD